MKVGDLIQWQSSVVGYNSTATTGILLDLIYLDPRSKFTQQCAVVLLKGGKIATVFAEDIKVINEDI